MSDNTISYSSENENLVSGEPLVEDQELEILSLRPEKLYDYVGQSEVVETLKIAIEAVVLPGWGKPPWPISLPMKWAAPLRLPPDRRLKRGGI